MAAFPTVMWFLTSALGVVIFGFVMRRPIQEDRAGSVLVGAVAAGALADEVIEPSDADLPRWLRPSLRDERQGGPRPSVPAVHEPVRFDRPPRPGVERRTIAYRLVRVSDAPDEIRSQEVGRVDRGDEVEIVGEADGFLRIVTPWGVEGWVPRVVMIG